MRQGSPRLGPAALTLLIGSLLLLARATRAQATPGQESMAARATHRAAAYTTSGPDASSTPKKRTWKLSATWSDSVGFDSNPTRVEPVSGLPTHSSAFAAGLLKIALEAIPWGQQLAADLGLGTKLHFSDKAKSADIFITKANLGWRAQAGSLALSLTGSYFESREDLGRDQTETRDATDLPATLDFRILSAEAAAEGTPARNIQVRAGLRLVHFSYLPDQAMSYQGLSPFLRIATTFDLAKEAGAHQLTLSAETAAAWNRYPNWPDERRDLAPILNLEATYLGWCLVRLSYQLWANFSPDPTWSSTRHSLSLQAAMALPWKLYAVAEATLQYLDYASGLLLYTPSSSSDFARLDQEGRSSLLLSIQRSLTKRYSLQFRYLLYFDITAPIGPTGAAGRYQRHLVTLDIQASLP